MFCVFSGSRRRLPSLPRAHRQRGAALLGMSSAQLREKERGGGLVHQVELSVWGARSTAAIGGAFCTPTYRAKRDGTQDGMALVDGDAHAGAHDKVWGGRGRRWNGTKGRMGGATQGPSGDCLSERNAREEETRARWGYSQPKRKEKIKTSARTMGRKWRKEEVDERAPSPLFFCAGLPFFYAGGGYMGAQGMKARHRSGWPRRLIRASATRWTWDEGPLLGVAVKLPRPAAFEDVILQLFTCYLRGSGKERVGGGSFGFVVWLSAPTMKIEGAVSALFDAFIAFRLFFLFTALLQGCPTSGSRTRDRYLPS